jgi:hypothetical protein
MAWTKRERGTRYYQRSRREGDRVVTEYFGASETAVAIAQLDEHLRKMRQWADARTRDERTRLEALDATLGDYYRAVETQMKRALIALGFRRHARGEWRRRRGGGGDVTKSGASGASRTKRKDMDANHVSAAGWRDMDALERQQLLDAAQRGDRRAVALVMVGAEEDADLYDQLTNSARREREALIATACGANVLMRGSLLEQTQHREDQLLAESAYPSTLERALIERTATCWLAAHLADLEAEGRMQSDTPLSVALARFYEQRRALAHERYLRATLTLARVRRLLRPRRRCARVNRVTVEARS